MANSNKVFIPGALPESTYITRTTKSGFTYEERLKQALSVNGYLTLISGPSKIGKTVLCEKVIGLDNLVEVSGSDMLAPKELWTQIGTKAGMPFEGIEQSFEKNYEKYYLTKETVLNYFYNKNLVLFIDDFHYASKEMQTFMAEQFKDAIRKGLRIIIASLPHRIDDTIRTNPDLQGRISIIDMQAWNTEELKQIPQKGFPELGFHVSNEIITTIANESISSPQLMQLICLNICVLAESRNLNNIDINLVKDAFRFSTLNLDYAKVVDVIQTGKASRGKKRAKYSTKQYGSLDLYGIILESLALDPPFAKITCSDLYKRIEQLIITDNKPSINAVKSYLKNMQDVINSYDNSYEVFEWKDNILYILESLFLFYLRWGRGTNNAA